MKNLLRWVKTVFQWARRVPISSHFWSAVAVVLASVLLVWAYDWHEKAFRLTGMGLQLAGVLTVVWGISKTRADFGHKAIVAIFKVWLKSFPPFLPRTVTGTATGIFAPLTVEAYGTTSHGPSPDQSLEGRLTHLEQVMSNLDKALGRVEVTVYKTMKETERAIEEKARHLASKIDNVDGKIEATATGGLYISAVGAIFLFVGTVFGGAGPELQQLLTR